ncbi:hypothetical protein AALP_AA2G067100 [Arabis alpina]|uniref:Uncharacterized protein n=1 Tax=Arabis alpina TaxID=50452 RepID=A0A087HFR1_ARAAL|nr:hypothetical protein AALP_AA2G067100 [Arabis alpina]
MGSLSELQDGELFLRRCTVESLIGGSSATINLVFTRIGHVCV